MTNKKHKTSVAANEDSQ